MAPERKAELEIEGAATDRRARILGAAATVFARHGYHRTRTREIAAEAGVAEGTIFNYFPTKRDLLFAIIESMVTETVPALFANLDSLDTPDAIRALILDRLLLLDRNRELFLAVAPELFFDRELREAFLEQVVMPTLTWLLPAAQLLLGRPEVKAANPRVVMPAFMGGVVASYIANKYESLPVGQPISWEELADQLARLYIEGMLQTADEPKGDLRANKEVP